MINLLAIIGPKGSGKTTLANQLRDHGWKTTSFSTPIKRMLGTFLLDQGVSTSDIAGMLYGYLKETPTSYLNNQTPRHALQTLGTEWRNLIHKNIWLDAWERTINLKTEKIIIDDARFVHEANRILELGGKIILITRDQKQNLDPHPSEQEFLNIVPDFIIDNNHHPEDMLFQSNHFLKGEIF